MDIDSEVTVEVLTGQALFRVLQEALANVARHSQADTVTVVLKSENGRVTLLVEDNGKGFDPDRVGRGVGLDSMRERLAAVNGELQVSSLQPRGTRVTAKVRRL